MSPEGVPVGNRGNLEEKVSEEVRRLCQERSYSPPDAVLDKCVAEVVEKWVNRWAEEGMTAFGSDYDDWDKEELAQFNRDETIDNLYENRPPQLGEEVVTAMLRAEKKAKRTPRKGKML